MQSICGDWCKVFVGTARLLMQMPPSPFVILYPSTEFSPQVVESARHCSQSCSSEQGLPAVNGRQLLVHDQDPLVPLVPFCLQVTIPISPAKNKNLDFCQKKNVTWLVLTLPKLAKADFLWILENCVLKFPSKLIKGNRCKNGKTFINIYETNWKSSIHHILSNGDHHILTPPLEMRSNTVFVNADNLRQR